MLYNGASLWWRIIGIFLSPRNPFLAFFSIFVLIEDNLIKLTTFFTSAILSIQPVLKDETY